MKSSADHARLALLLSHPPKVLKCYKDITPSSELVESTNASMPDATKRSGVDLERLASGIAIVTSTGQYFATRSHRINSCKEARSTKIIFDVTTIL